MTRVRLAEIAHARSGDKADLALIALFAPSDAVYRTLLREVTAARVKAHFGEIVHGDVERFEAANVRGLTFVLHGALDGGAGMSLRSDVLGKSLGAMLLRLEIDVDDHLLNAAAPSA